MVDWGNLYERKDEPQREDDDFVELGGLTFRERHRQLVQTAFPIGLHGGMYTKGIEIQVRRSAEVREESY